jgi:hypothetical protein
MINYKSHTLEYANDSGNAPFNTHKRFLMIYLLCFVSHSTQFGGSGG